MNALATLIVTLVFIGLAWLLSWHLAGTFNNTPDKIANSDGLADAIKPATASIAGEDAGSNDGLGTHFNKQFGIQRGNNSSYLIGGETVPLEVK